LHFARGKGIFFYHGAGIFIIFENIEKRLTKHSRDGKMFPTQTSEEETCRNEGEGSSFVLVRFFVFYACFSGSFGVYSAKA